MLETPKIPFPYKEKQRKCTMDNQQATHDWARLAGLLLGDGYFSLEPYPTDRKSQEGFIALRPAIVFTNQDATLVELFMRVYDREGIKYYLENRAPKGLTRFAIMNVKVHRFDSVRKALDNLLPWLVGDKKVRAECLLRYVSKERRGRRCFDSDDWDILNTYVMAFPPNKKGKETRLVKVLRDYTPGAEDRDDIVQPTAESVE